MYHNRFHSAFTLIELMIVIVVIAILATLTIVGYRHVQDDAKQAATLSAFDSFEQMLRSYKGAKGYYPPTQQVSGDGTTVTQNNGSTTGGYVCLGSTFPADPPFAANQCVKASSSSLNTVNNQSVYDALKTIDINLPNSVGKPVLSSTANIRGVLYSSQRRADGSSQNTSLLFAPPDGQTCGRGTINTSLFSIPVCYLSLS